MTGGGRRGRVPIKKWEGKKKTWRERILKGHYELSITQGPTEGSIAEEAIFFWGKGDRYAFRGSLPKRGTEGRGKLSTKKKPTKGRKMEYLTEEETKTT